MVSTTKKKAPAKKGIAKVEKKAPAVIESQSDNVLHALTESISSGKLQPEQLTMILDAQERILNRNAKMEYAAAMSACQAEIPTVLKNKMNDQTHSSYEDLESLNSVLKPVYTRHGFAVSFNTAPAVTEGWIRTIGTVTHRGGHSEIFDGELPLDEAGIKGNVNKTPVHAVASSRSYARRYMLRDIFNLTTSEDVDDDGNAAGAEPVLLINDSQIADMRSLMDEIGVAEAEFLRVAKYENIEMIPVDRYNAAIGMLKRRQEAQA